MSTAVKECRLTPREPLSEPVLVRPCDPLFPEEICTTANVSRSGLYFVTPTKHYFVGMNVLVTLNFGPDDPKHREQIGDVVRVERVGRGQVGSRHPDPNAQQSGNLFRHVAFCRIKNRPTAGRYFPIQERKFREFFCAAQTMNLSGEYWKDCEIQSSVANPGMKTSKMACCSPGSPVLILD